MIPVACAACGWSGKRKPGRVVICLCCWCKPGQPCHADVLLRLANEGEGE